MKDLRRRLDERADELGVIAHFDHDEVTAPTHE
jgi:predicted component of type VI protein secretion system